MNAPTLFETDPLRLDTQPVPAVVHTDTAALTITVFGDPAPQGSKRHVGHGVMLESSKKVKPWRQAVRTDAVHAIDDQRLCWTGPLDGPLLLEMVFTFARPRGHYRTGRNAHLLRDGAPARPATYPDLSKLARSTEDALKEAGVYADDSRVVEYRRLAKVYVGTDPDALASPGAVIRVYRIGATDA